MEITNVKDDDKVRFIPKNDNDILMLGIITSRCKEGYRQNWEGSKLQYIDFPIANIMWILTNY